MSQRKIKFRARRVGINTEFVKGYIGYINRRLTNYRYAISSDGEIGLRDAMRRNEKYSYPDLMLKIVDMAKRFHLALDQKEREIGLSVREWRQLVELFRSQHLRKS